VSRGLGDVYKRQLVLSVVEFLERPPSELGSEVLVVSGILLRLSRLARSISFTQIGRLLLGTALLLLFRALLSARTLLTEYATDLGAVGIETSGAYGRYLKQWP
jgi:hypothetical protein